jgi:hypothetical protein
MALEKSNSDITALLTEFVHIIDNFYLLRQLKIIFQISLQQENEKDLEHEEAREPQK